MKRLSDPALTAEARAWLLSQLDRPELIRQAQALVAWESLVASTASATRVKLDQALQALRTAQLDLRLSMVQTRADRLKATLRGCAAPTLEALRDSHSVARASALAEYRAACSEAWARLRAVKASRP